MFVHSFDLLDAVDAHVCGWSFDLPISPRPMA